MEGLNVVDTDFLKLYQLACSLLMELFEVASSFFSRRYLNLCFCVMDLCEINSYFSIKQN